MSERFPPQHILSGILSRTASQPGAAFQPTAANPPGAGWQPTAASPPGAGWQPTAGSWPPPELVVGDIEIRGGHIRIGGVDVTSPPEGQVRPLPALSSEQVSPTVPARGGASRTARSWPSVRERGGQTPELPVSRAPVAGVLQPLPLRRLEVGKSADPARAIADAVVSPVVLPEISPVIGEEFVPRDSIEEALGLGLKPEPGLVRGCPGTEAVVSRHRLRAFLTLPAELPRGWIGVGGAALVLWILAAVLSSLPLEVLIGGLLVAAILSIGVGVAVRRARGAWERLETGEHEQRLVLLADRLGGQLRTADVVRDLGMSFDEAEGLLRRLAARGHLTLAFDPRTDGPVYRVG